MWKCENCNREFETTNQSHFCNEPPQTIDAYINMQPEAIRPVLSRVHETIRAAIPEATEKIAWQMPTFWQGENIIHFAAHKKHLGLYPGGLSLTHFEERLAGYQRTKGAIQFPYDKPIDYPLIGDIAAWCAACARERRKPSERVYAYDGVIVPVDEGGAYVVFPYDVRREFGKGRVKVRATFDGAVYEGSLVNMGVKNPDGSVCYIIGIRKDILAKIDKKAGDTIHVTIKERQ